MTRFNWKIFAIANVLIIALLVFSFLNAWSDDDGTLPKDSNWQIFVKIFYILRFPTHTLCWKYISESHSSIPYLAGLFINCLFYALLIERLIYFFKRKPKASY